MKLFLRILGGIALAAGLSPAADPKTDVEKAERAWAAAVVKADTTALEKLMATDLLYTHSSGNRDTRATFLDRIAKGTLKYTRIEYQKIDVQMVKPDVAVLAARADIGVVSNGHPADMKVSVLHVLVKREGRWQLLAHQSARLP